MSEQDDAGVLPTTGEDSPMIQATPAPPEVIPSRVSPAPEFHDTPVITTPAHSPGPTHGHMSQDNRQPHYQAMTRQFQQQPYPPPYMDPRYGHGLDMQYQLPQHPHHMSMHNQQFRHPFHNPYDYLPPTAWPPHGGAGAKISQAQGYYQANPYEQEMWHAPKTLWVPPQHHVVASGTFTRSRGASVQATEKPARKPRATKITLKGATPLTAAAPNTPLATAYETGAETPAYATPNINAHAIAARQLRQAAGGGDGGGGGGDSESEADANEEKDDENDDASINVEAEEEFEEEEINNDESQNNGGNNGAPSGGPGGTDPPGDPSNNADDNNDDDQRPNRTPPMIQLISATQGNSDIQSALNNMSNNLSSMREVASRPIMQVEQVKMSLTKLNKKSIDEFNFKSQIACADLINFNPATWLSAEVLEILLLRAKKDVAEASRNGAGLPRFSGYSRMTVAQLYTKIGTRSITGELTGVNYILKIMTRRIVDTKHLFENCLAAFQEIECRGANTAAVRGMHTQVARIHDHWTVTMEYSIDVYLATQIAKSLNSKISGKLFESNFYRSLLGNKMECKKQQIEEKTKLTADNDIVLWLAVVDYTISTFEDQMEFAAGSGKPPRPPSETRTRGREKTVASVQEKEEKRKPKGRAPPSKTVRFHEKKKAEEKAEEKKDTSKMTCFNCGLVGVKTGHDDCKHKEEPNAKGTKAKEAYRKKREEKRKTSEKTAVANIDSDSESDSDEEEDMCMITSWDRSDDLSESDDDDENPPMLMAGHLPSLIPLIHIVEKEEMEKAPELIPMANVLKSRRKFYTPDADFNENFAYVDKRAKILKPGKNKLAIFQSVIINSAEATVMFDTGALGNGGNWISEEAATRLNAFLEPTKRRSYVSPLFPDAKYVSKTKTSLSILFSSFGFEIEHIEFRIMQASSMKAEIILGLEFIEQNDIMSYLTHPLQYNAVAAHPSAEEENLDWEEGIFAFQSAILNMGERERKLASKGPYNYRSGKNVCISFPRRERVYNILDAFDGNTLAQKLDTSTIDHPPMNIQPIKPFKGCKPRRLNKAKEDFLDIWLDRNLAGNVIEPCAGQEHDTSMPTSPLVLVAKPKEATDPFRVTLDAVMVNGCLPLIQVESPITRECLQKLGSHDYYWQADMLDYFFQFKISPAMSNLYAFSTHRGNFRFKDILPQGDKNSPAWTTNAMQYILIPINHEVTNYVDDFAGGDDDPDILCDKLERFLTLMRSVNAKFSPEKIKVGFKEITVLGFVVNKNGYRPKTNQLEKFAEAPFPTKDKLRSWFGLLNTFKDFIPGLEEVDAAFSAVRKKNAVWKVTPAMITAFDKAKTAVSQITLLTFPDPSKELLLDADASDLGCGAMLYNLAQDGVTKLPIRFMSHVFTTAAIKWSTIEKECWALVKAFNVFEFFLFGRNFKVRTDHRNLLYMQHSCNMKVQRWFGYLMLFDFVIIHVPGVDNIVADALSRVFATMFSLNANEALTDNVSDTEDQREIEQQQNITAAWDQASLQEFFKRFHNGVTGHLSLANTIAAMREAGCDAPHLKQAVIRMMATCGPCEKARSIRPKPLLEYHTNSSFKPFEVFQADFLTGIGKSDKGFSCILSFVCTYAY